MAAAEIIKNLAQAAEKVNLESKKASAELRTAAEEAVITVKKAAAKAAELVHKSIDDANEKILQATSGAIRITAGDKEANIFEQGSLKEKWSDRRG